MKKIYSAALAQGYVLKAPTCGSCSFLRVDRVLPAWMEEENLRGAFWKLETNGIEKTARCGKGGFTVKKMAICNCYEQLTHAGAPA